MDLQPLQLTVIPGSWQKFNARKHDKAFQAFRDKVLARDNFTCQYCGFQAKEYQEVVNLDHDYTNNKLSNLATACCFCTQCCFLESVGVSGFGGGILIYLSEMQQAELNALCHVLFCAIANGTNYAESAQQIYRSLKFRSQVIEDYFGDGTSKPAVFGRLMLSTQTKSDIMQETLVDLRLLPSHTKFKTQIDTWAKAALAELPDE